MKIYMLQSTRLACSTGEINFFFFESEVNFGGFQSPEVRELFFEKISIFVYLMRG